jgi:hypothetical protein
MAESEGSFGMTDDSAGPRPLRRAKVFDGRKDDGSPLVLRPDLASLDEIMRVVGYLKAAPTILLGRGLDKDAWSPDDPPAVPRTFSTDGTWIWSGAVTFYLQKYGMPVEPDLLAHIRALNHVAPEVSAEAREAAGRQVLSRDGAPSPVPTPSS